MSCYGLTLLLVLFLHGIWLNFGFWHAWLGVSCESWHVSFAVGSPLFCLSEYLLRVTLVCLFGDLITRYMWRSLLLLPILLPLSGSGFGVRCYKFFIMGNFVSFQWFMSLSIFSGFFDRHIDNNFWLLSIETLFAFPVLFGLQLMFRIVWNDFPFPPCLPPRVPILGFGFQMGKVNICRL